MEALSITLQGPPDIQLSGCPCKCSFLEISLVGAGKYTIGHWYLETEGVTLKVPAL
jgi:hypothetical protein